MSRTDPSRADDSIGTPVPIARSGWLGLHDRVVRGERGFGPALLRVLLVPSALVYSAIAVLRNALFDIGALHARRVDARVISVGNLTAGGTGKTPVVALLARAALAAGHRPAVLTRGYRRRGAERSDEAALLERLLPGVPIVVDPDRVRGAAQAIASGADLLLLDDGFQHRRLARDVDLVLVDARDPFGGGWQLPRGLLREPPRGLSRASAVLVTRADRARPAALAELRQNLATHSRRSLPIVAAEHRAVAIVDLAGRPVDPIESLRGRRVLAFSALADPRTLEETLAALGAEVVAVLAFPDHHEYLAAELASIAAAAASANVSRIVTTEKDAVRIRDFPGPLAPVALRIEADVALENDRMALERVIGFPIV